MKGVAKNIHLLSNHDEVCEDERVEEKAHDFY